jgi:hypothetical protein
VLIACFTQTSTAIAFGASAGQWPPLNAGSG